MARVNPGRLAAARALLDVETGAHADESLARHAPSEPRDRGLAWHLCLGVLRYRGELRARIEKVTNRPCGELDRTVLVALEVGTFEVCHSQTKPHAAVHQGVELAKALRAGRAKGLVNAVLRRVGGEQSFPQSINHPEWLVKDWKSRFGEAETERWCGQNDQVAPLAVVLRDPNLRDAWKSEGIEMEPAQVAGRPLEKSFWVHGNSGPIEQLPGYQEGSFWVMDPAAVLAADLMGVKKDQRILDACAAPGGKSLRMAQAGARVLACDRAAPRLKMLEGSVDRVGLPVEYKVWDWEQRSTLEVPRFDGVLVDAPCTGLGTLRRHPEIRWRALVSDPAAMALRQLPILKAASEHLRPGGTLVYSVCSPMEAEGSGVVQAFLEEKAGYVLEEEVLTAPPVGDEDSFYAARLRRGEG